MTDTLDFAQWARNWEAMSREYLAKMPGTSSMPPAWNPQDAFGTAQWSRQFGGATAQNDTMERMLAGAQGYLGMLQGMAAGAGGTAGMPSASWLDALNSSTGFAPGMPSWVNNPLTQAMRSFGGHGAQGFEQMMQRFTSAAAPMLNEAKGVLTLPAFGHLREHQENAQKTAQAMIEYQEQMARYNRIMLKVSEQGFARFQLKLAEREEPGRQIDSVRGIYDLWIDAAEEAYAEVALSEEFRDIYGSLVNAQMRVREQVQREIERISSDLGVPTRSEIDSIGERLQALRREFRAERESAGDIEVLSAEVATLRNEIAILREAAKPAARSNVIDFVRPKPAPAASAARPRRARPKAKSMRQVVRAASKVTASTGKPAASKAQPSPPARAKPQRAAATAKVGGDSPGFAARIARFARDHAAEAASPGKLKPNKSGKR